MTNEWIGCFNEAKQAVEYREKMRKEYDHYDEKIEEMLKKRGESREPDTPEKLEYYRRVRSFNFRTRKSTNSRLRTT